MSHLLCQLKIEQETMKRLAKEQRQARLAELRKRRAVQKPDETNRKETINSGALAPTSVQSSVVKTGSNEDSTERQQESSIQLKEREEGPTSSSTNDESNKVQPVDAPSEAAEKTSVKDTFQRLRQEGKHLANKFVAAFQKRLNRKDELFSKLQQEYIEHAKAEARAQELEKFTHER